MAATVAELVANLRVNTRDFDRGLASAEQSMRRFEGQTSRTGSALSKIGGEAIKTVGAISTAGVGLATSAAFIGADYNVLLQKTNKAFETLLGSADKATEMITDLEEFAKESPFPRQTFIAASQELIGFGIQAKKVVPIFEAIEDAAAGIGGGVPEIQRFTNIFSQIQSFGRANTETLMRFSSAGIDAFKILADQAGVSVSEMRDRVTEGAVGATEAIDGLTAGLTAKFEGAAAGVKSTWIGAVDRIKGAWRDISSTLVAPFIDPQGGGFAVDWANRFATILRRDLLPYAEKVGESVKRWLRNFDDLGEAFDNLRLPQFVDSIKDLLPYLKTLAPAIAGIGIASSVSALHTIPLLKGLIEFIPGLSSLTSGWGMLGLAMGGMILASDEGRRAVSRFVEALIPLGKQILPVIIVAAAEVADAFIEIAPSLIDIVSSVLELVPAFVDLARVGIGAVLAVAKPFIPVIAAIADFFAGMPALVVPVIVLWKTWSSTNQIVARSMSALLGSLGGGTLAFGLLAGGIGIATAAMVGAQQVLAGIKQNAKEAFDAWADGIDLVLPGEAKLFDELNRSMDLLYARREELVRDPANSGAFEETVQNILPWLPNLSAELKAEIAEIDAMIAIGEAQRDAIHRFASGGEIEVPTVIRRTHTKDAPGYENQLVPFKTSTVDVLGPEGFRDWGKAQQAALDKYLRASPIHADLGGAVKWTQNVEKGTIDATFANSKLIESFIDLQVAEGKIDMASFGDDSTAAAAAVNDLWNKAMLSGDALEFMAEAAGVTEAELRKFLEVAGRDGDIELQRFMTGLTQAAEKAGEFKQKMIEVVTELTDPKNSLQAALNPEGEVTGNTFTKWTKGILDDVFRAGAMVEDLTQLVKAGYYRSAQAILEQGDLAPDLAAEAAGKLNRGALGELERFEAGLLARTEQITSANIDQWATWISIVEATGATGSKASVDAIAEKLGVLPSQIEEIGNMSIDEAVIAMTALGITATGPAGQSAKDIGEEIANQLGIEVSEVDRVMGLYEKAIMTPLNRILVGLGRKPLVLPKTYGALEKQYQAGATPRPLLGAVRAEGGFDAPHTAQIAPGGAWRVWAEPETGGEAYIPLAGSKRSRSTGILNQVAEHFGLALSPKNKGAMKSFAEGGIIGNLHAQRDMLQREFMNILTLKVPYSKVPDTDGLHTAAGASAGTGKLHALSFAAEQKERIDKQIAAQALLMAAAGGGDPGKYSQAMLWARSKIAEIFGLTNVGGYRNKGSVKGSDHPRHRAWDFMTGSNTRLGNQISQWHIDNAAAAQVKYIIFNDRDWNPRAGWTPYRHPSNPSGSNPTLAHRDHVHVSYLAQGGLLDGINTFDSGGMLPTGLSLAYNGTGSPERVLGPGDTGRTTNVTYHIHDATDPQKVVEAIERYERSRGERFVKTRGRR